MSVSGFACAWCARCQRCADSIRRYLNVPFTPARRLQRRRHSGRRYGGPWCWRHLHRRHAQPPDDHRWLEDMNLSSTDPTLAGTGTKTLTLPYLGPVGSMFKTALVVITMTNSGQATAMETSINVSTILPSGYAPADAALRDQMYVCISSPAGPTGAIVYDGLVTGAGLQVLTRTVAPGMSDSYSAEFYAGTQTTACTGKSGAATAVATGLDNAAQGGVFTPNVTVSFVQ